MSWFNKLFLNHFEQFKRSAPRRPLAKFLLDKENSREKVEESREEVLTSSDAEREKEKQNDAKARGKNSNLFNSLEIESLCRKMQPFITSSPEARQALLESAFIADQVFIGN